VFSFFNRGSDLDCGANRRSTAKASARKGSAHDASSNSVGVPDSSGESGGGGSGGSATVDTSGAPAASGDVVDDNDDDALDDSLAAKMLNMKAKLAARRHERADSAQSFKTRLEAKLTTRDPVTPEDCAEGRFSAERHGVSLRKPTTGDALPPNRHGPVVSVLPVSGRSWLDAIAKCDTPWGWSSRESNPQQGCQGTAATRAYTVMADEKKG